MTKIPNRTKGEASSRSRFVGDRGRNYALAARHNSLQMMPDANLPKENVPTVYMYNRDVAPGTCSCHRPIVVYSTGSYGSCDYRIPVNRNVVFSSSYGAGCGTEKHHRSSECHAEAQRTRGLLKAVTEPETQYCIWQFFPSRTHAQPYCTGHPSRSVTLPAIARLLYSLLTSGIMLLCFIRHASCPASNRYHTLGD